jgi:hypothetical protein
VYLGGDQAMRLRVRNHQGAKSLARKRKRKSTAGRSRAENTASQRVIGSLNTNASCIDELRAVYIEARKGVIDAYQAKVYCQILRELRAAINDERLLSEFGQDLQAMKAAWLANGHGPLAMRSS